MKGLSHILVISFLILTSSCSNQDDYGGLELDHNSKQILFFSDENDYYHDAPYYDAIIELKKDYPEAFDSMIVLSGDTADKRYFKMFDIEKYPTILIYYHDEVVVKVNGSVSKDQIIQPLAKVLSHDIITQTP